jgi:hypothetical protein
MELETQKKKRMYKNVQVIDNESGRWMDYTVTPDANKFNGYVVKDSKGQSFQFSHRDADYEFVSTTPRYYTETVVCPTKVRKAPIYKRYSPVCRRDRYDYAFTNVIRKTKEEVHDVYYNYRRNRFIDNVSSSNWFYDTYGFSY